MSIVTTGGFSEEFEQPTENIHPSYDDVLQREIHPVVLRDVEIADDCDAELARSLLSVARFEKVPPPLKGSGGRTLILQHKISGVRAKLKGAAGIEKAPSGHIIRTPKAHTLYEMNQPYHIGIDENFLLRVVESSPRYLFSLSDAGSRTEFGAHNKLSRVGLSTRQLVRGTFDQQKDGSGRDTGFVAIRLPEEAYELGNFTELPMLPIDKNNVRPVGYDRSRTLDSVLNFYAGIYGKIAAGRRRAIFDAGVARHAGHHGNIMLTMPELDIQFLDLDSVIDFHALSKKQRSAQVLRDVTGDIARLIHCYRVSLLQVDINRGLENSETNPLNTFLQNFFRGHNDPHEIALAALEITQEFQEVLCEDLESIAAQMELARCMENKESGNADGISGGMFVRNHEIWPWIMRVLYQLLQSGTMPKQYDLSYPDVIGEKHIMQWNSVLQDFIKRMKKVGGDYVRRQM